MTYEGSPLQQNHNYIIQLSTIYTSTFQYRRYLLSIIDNIAPANLTANFNVPELQIIDGVAQVHFEDDKSTHEYYVAVIVEYLG